MLSSLKIKIPVSTTTVNFIRKVQIVFEDEALFFTLVCCRISISVNCCLWIIQFAIENMQIHISQKLSLVVVIAVVVAV